MGLRARACVRRCWTGRGIWCVPTPPISSWKHPNGSAFARALCLLRALFRSLALHLSTLSFACVSTGAVARLSRVRPCVSVFVCVCVCHVCVCCVWERGALLQMCLQRMYRSHAMTKRTRACLELSVCAGTSFEACMGMMRVYVCVCGKAQVGDVRSRGHALREPLSVQRRGHLPHVTAPRAF